MIAVIIAFVIVVLSFNFFMMSYQINGIDRLVMGMPVALYETAINLFDINENIGPVFDRETLEENITYYFNRSMDRYSDDYSLSFYYYNPEDHSMCLDENYRAVEVTLNAKIILYNTYEKTMFYEIRSN